MKLKKILFIFLLAISSESFAYTECSAKIKNYFVGTSQKNQPVAHLWVSLEGGGTASVSSEGAGYQGMLATTLASMMSDKAVKLRLLADNADCKAHNGDWVGIWIYK